MQCTVRSGRKHTVHSFPGTEKYNVQYCWDGLAMNRISNELWVSDQFLINTSIGLMNKVSPGLFLVGGYSNYLEIRNSTLNEAFMGYSSNSTTGVVFFGLSSEISPNYLGIINLNSFLPKISYDASIMCIISKEMDNLGYDLFLNMTKTFDSGFTIGSSISSERYEDSEIRTFKKQGNEKTYNVPVLLQGGFISFFMGWTF